MVRWSSSPERTLRRTYRDHKEAKYICYGFISENWWSRHLHLRAVQVYDGGGKLICKDVTNPAVYSTTE